MKKVAAILLLVLPIPLLWLAPAHAQQKTESLVGAVAQIDVNNKTATIKTDNGTTINLKADDNTICLRIPSGEKSLSKATPIKFADIAAGDRVLAHGTKPDQIFLAQRLVVMPAAELARKREHDLEDWKQRGIGGVVRELNPQTNEITLELRGANAGRVLVDTSKATLRRYLPGSLRFEDARASNFADLRVGDQLRALGNKTADGKALAAEQIVSGTFRTIGVTIVEINQQTGEIKATTLDQKKPITITVNQDSTLRRISPAVANAIAQKAKGEPARPAGTPATSPQTQRPAAQPVIDVQHMIDTLPTVARADLKPGDVLAVTGAVENDDSRLIAIKVAAGVDLVLRALAPAPGRPQVVRLSAGLPTVFDFSVIPVN